MFTSSFLKKLASFIPNLFKDNQGYFVLFGTDIVPNGTVIVQKGTV